MGMKNLDKTIDMTQIRAQVDEALKNNNSEDISEALVRMAEGIQENILKEAQTQARSLIRAQVNDRNVLNERGMNVLTTEERKYYEQVIEKRAFTNLDVALPKTVFDRVFDELDKEHPLLNKIAFQNTTAVTEWVIRKTDCEAAWWGKLTDTIKKELSQGFDKIKTDMYKLTAYMPVSKAMLDLGPEWLDRYVRAVLSESISMALEYAIVAGTGKDQPIGMIKDLKGSVVEGVYPDKAAIKLNDFKPTTLGKSVMAPLTKGGSRAVPSILMLVNPLDYWEKVFGATTFLTLQGTYVHGVMPIPSEIIQSVAVPKGKLIAGMGKDYFMGIGSSQKIEYSDEYKFLDDERTYVSKQYATGEPIDNESFLVFDITKLSVDVPVESK
ncbi:mAjor capsid protein a [[Clostridium] sordellii]|uniref:Major capsid protein a n=2 Tax=Paraclostridium sordellii TaxID=1505 RepID=A0ABP1XW86_PARSO|nr:phage major capsid protein [Paeniclostridium sordellii]MCQ4699088.1 phage major capsid protein [Paeniclostridium sordellii]MVO70823.1 phage major capsid protein [Paeniclostridium sordellii]CEJ75438.1 major capsid protein a (plasmid) [[Clostridium] sordellii] [Paeniclostridium sordellii]CEN67980.1 mAjor capsid protein a [[Clostridium] sordellii] [Paeniclostridium sordellii]CEN71279.1 mAjor capsid protein a [[Clostridium] sordellii] [Paeniclostridium sordellii]